MPRRGGPGECGARRVAGRAGRKRRKAYELPDARTSVGRMARLSAKGKTGAGVAAAGRKGGAARRGFEGFADLRFFRELAANQSRDWYLAHKTEHEQGFVRPMEAALAEVARKLDRAYPDCEFAAPKVFRIQRDVRFSADKTPYKTNCAGVLAVKKGPSKVTETPAAVYLHVGVEGAERTPVTMAGAGLYMMDAPQLSAFRSALLDDARGRELAAIVAGLEKRGLRMMSSGTLKSAPRGVDPAHPRIELLKRKGLVAMFGEPPAGALRSPELLDWLVPLAKLAAPLVRWLVFNVA